MFSRGRSVNADRADSRSANVLQPATRMGGNPVGPQLWSRQSTLQHRCLQHCKQQHYHFRLPLSALRGQTLRLPRGRGTACLSQHGRGPPPVTARTPAIRGGAPDARGVHGWKAELSDQLSTLNGQRLRLAADHAVSRRFLSRGAEIRTRDLQSLPRSRMDTRETAPLSQIWPSGGRLRLASFGISGRASVPVLYPILDLDHGDSRLQQLPHDEVQGVGGQRKCCMTSVS